MPSLLENDGAKKESTDSPFTEALDATPDQEAQSLEQSFLNGWRFYGTIIGLYLGLFLATMEVSIVSTALVAITNDLGDFEQSTWVITSYLLTYTGFLVVWAQFSDVLGRKLFVALAVIIFMIFSGACAGAQTATQLIIFRAFQGIGGAGIYNMAMVILADAVPAEDFPKYVSLVAAITAIAFAIGPLIGGALTSHATWRWVFWVNLPIGLLALLADMVAIPNSFPHHKHLGKRPKLTISSLKRLDILGALLFLALSVCFVAALQEASVAFAWNSGVAIALLIISGVSLIAFVLWERFLAVRNKSIVPVLSWNLATRRSLGLFMASFLIGAPFTCATIQIPQRFQTVNGLSSYDAGVRLLPFIVMSPVGAVIGAGLATKFKTKPTFALLGGTALQLVGAICFVTLPYSTEIKPSQYAFQILFGLGSGISNAIATTSVPFVVQRKDIPTALGANTQFRYLGGAIGLGLITCILNSGLRPKLASILDPEQLSAIFHSTEIIKTLPGAQRKQVLLAFAAGFDLQWKAILAFISAQVPAALMMW